MRTQLLYLTIAGLFASQILFAQSEPVGIRVDEKNTFALPVDQLDIRPWSEGFSISFTVDFSQMRSNDTYSLLSLRSREWDGTDKEEKGTFWLGYECLDANSGIMRAFARQYDFYDGGTNVVGMTEKEFPLQMMAGSKHNVTLVWRIVQDAALALDTDIEHLVFVDRSIDIYIDGVKKATVGDKISDYCWRESLLLMIGDAAGGALSLNAALYDFKYYATQLGEEEVAALCGMPYSGDGNLSCEGYWDFSSGKFEGKSQGRDANLVAQLIDYRSDSLVVPTAIRPAKFAQPFSLDSINYVYTHFDGTDYDGALPLNLSILGCDEVKAVLQGDSVVVNKYKVSYSPDNSKMWVAGKLYYDFDWEVGDTLETDMFSSCGGRAVVMDKYYMDGRLYMVFDCGLNKKFQAAGKLPGSNVPENIVGQVRSRFCLLDGLGAWIFTPAGDTSPNLIRAIKHGDELIYRNPMYWDDVSTFSIGSYGGAVNSVLTSGAYIVIPSTVTDQLTVSRTDGSEVDLSSVRIHAAHGGIVSPASVSGNVMGVGNLPCGVYLLVLTDAEGTHVMKFVKT